MLGDEDYYKPFLHWARDVMCNVVSLSVPIEVDFKVGKQWGELEGIKLKPMNRLAGEVKGNLSGSEQLPASKAKGWGRKGRLAT